MPLGPTLFFRARPLGQVTVAAGLMCLLVLIVCNAHLPAMTPSENIYNATITYAIAPALASAVALGLLGSRMHTWENSAARPLWPMRLIVGTLAFLLALAIVLPSAPRAELPSPVPAAFQGVFMCTGLGMISSRWLAYPAQAGIVFLYGLISLNTAWALRDQPLGAVLVIGAQPQRGTLLAAATVAVGGLLTQQTHSSRLQD